MLPDEDISDAPGITMAKESDSYVSVSDAAARAGLFVIYITSDGTYVFGDKRGKRMTVAPGDTEQFLRGYAEGLEIGKKP